MRISVKITSWLDSWYPRFPRIDLDACYPKREDGEAELDALATIPVRKHPTDSGMDICADADLNIWKASPYVYDALEASLAAQMALRKTRIEWEAHNSAEVR